MKTELILGNIWLFLFFAAVTGKSGSGGSIRFFNWGGYFSSEGYFFFETCLLIIALWFIKSYYAGESPRAVP